MLYTPKKVMGCVKRYSVILSDLGKNIMLGKKVLIQGIENGGLKMPDIFVTIKAIKLMWLKEFAEEK